MKKARRKTKVGLALAMCEFSAGIVVIFVVVSGLLLIVNGMPIWIVRGLLGWIVLIGLSDVGIIELYSLYRNLEVHWFFRLFLWRRKGQDYIGSMEFRELPDS